MPINNRTVYKHKMTNVYTTWTVGLGEPAAHTVEVDDVELDVKFVWPEDMRKLLKTN